jgi:glycosyltransferase 2 family protein
LSDLRQFTIGLSVAAVTIFLIFKNVPVDELLTSFQNVEYKYLFLTALIVLLSYLVRVFRWQVLVSHIQPVTVGQLLPPMMISLLGTMLPMRAGEVLRAYLLKKKTNIPFTGSIATILVERMFDILMLNLLFTWVLVFYSELFNSETTWLGLSPSTIAFNFGCLSGATFCCLLIVVYFLAYKTSPLIKIIERVASPFPANWWKNCERLLQTFAQSLTVIKHKNALLKLSLYSLLDWTLLIFAAYPMYLAFDLNNKTLESMLVLAVMVPIFMTLLPTPGFVGSVQAGVFVALHKIMGEDAVLATAYGMVGWAWGLAIQLVVGFFFLFREHISLKTLLKLEKENEE